MKKIATIGFFDGVHKGHCFLFNHLRRLAAENALQPLIVTFIEHPRLALQADYVPQLLTTFEERKSLLETYGEVLVLSFAQVQPLTAAQFMEMLHTQYDVSVLLMGYDHRFGSDRLHRPQDYRLIGRQNGIDVVTLGEFIDGEWHVSSTEIRSALHSGNIVMANELLGRPYSLSGVVVHGNGIGRNIGFPTANIQPLDPHKILPKSGVYVVSVHVDGAEWLPAILNLGTNPTVGNSSQTIEVHIPSFKADLYGRMLEIRFERFIREEKRFDSLTELREQIAIDVDNNLRLA